MVLGMSVDFKSVTVDTETGQQRLRLCGNNQEKCQGYIKHVRQKRQSYDNKVLLK